MRCPDCGSENLEGSRFCSFCSKPLPQTIICPSCGGEILQESLFCSFCARRLDPAQPAGARGGAVYKQSEPPPAGAPVTEPRTGDEKSEGPETGTASTTFCHVCAEPTASDQLHFDIDGNRVCKQCLRSGGKKKSPKTRRMEAMKLQIEGKGDTTIDRRGIPKIIPFKVRKAEEAEPRKGPRILLWGGMVLLLAGIAAGSYYFLVHAKQSGEGAGAAAGGPGATGKAPAPADAAPGKDGPASVEEPSRDPGAEAPSPETLDEPLLFKGTFRGVHPENGILSGAMMFESPTQGIVFVTLAPGLRKIAKTYTKGKTYEFKFKPDALFHTTRRVTLSMLLKPIRESK